ncbi:LADA_0H11452g1_1 [Lachancea dasiensis]|uniref:LADA_0H11452g1_1 n=1 Tax=Lachancea dasiensis TaxID=1072105 RepID=A0A1G4K3P8_9SACH|nr:LADA_0H11452g1_1 [Lachancea dasiensis]
MAKLSKLPKLSRRGRTALASAVCVYVLLAFQLHSWRVHSGFYKGLTTELPSTARAGDTNLKRFQPPAAAAADAAATGSLASLRSQLALQFPYDASQPMPKRVWQTWKTAVDSPQLSPEFRRNSGLWMEAAELASYQYALVPDAHVLALLHNLYGGVPQVIQAFESLPLPILKADFFRYLILYARGGIYSDMDTFPLKALGSWPPAATGAAIQYRGRAASSGAASSSGAPEAGFVVGIEADPDRVDWSDWYARRIQFCQWTIQSKPGHPLLRELIVNITATTLASTHVRSSAQAPPFSIDEDHRADYLVNCRDKRRFDDEFPASQKKTAANVDGTDTMNWTGPGVFSDAVFNYLDNLIATNPDVAIINDNLRAHGGAGTHKFYRKVTEGLESAAVFVKEFFTLIEEPVAVDDVLVLPITSFSPGVNQMNAKEDDHAMAFVKHMFEGSWKGTKPGTAPDT